MQNVLRRMRGGVALLGCLGVATVAAAGDWHVVGGDAYRDADGEWVAWISDGEGNHATIKGNSRRDAKRNAENAAEILNATDCVDPCVFHPDECNPSPNMLVAPAPDWELKHVLQGRDGQWTATIESDVGTRVGFTRSTAVLASGFAQHVASEFNAGYCVAF